MVYDFHSHALFNMDEGAKDMGMSKAMLIKSKDMGVDCVLLTSHCYPYSTKDIDRYIEKRELSYNALQGIGGMPELYKGCEAHLTGDITKFRDIKRLCIENTDYMLLEMPHTPWNDKTIENVYKLTLKGIIPIIAHDERNMHQKREFRNALYDLDVLIQINAPSLFMFSYRKEIDRMLKLGLGHIIGTDMHNLTSRKPCMDRAEKKIKHRYGAECWDYFMGNADKVLKNDRISYKEFKSFKKKNIL